MDFEHIAKQNHVHMVTVHEAMRIVSCADGEAVLYEHPMWVLEVTCNDDEEGFEVFPPRGPNAEPMVNLKELAAFLWLATAIGVDTDDVL